MIRIKSDFINSCLRICKFLRSLPTFIFLFQDFTVRALDLVTDFIFTELLELLDVEWRADGVGEEEGCRLFHLMPRFVRPLDASGQVIEMLSMDLVISYLLDAAKPVFDETDIDLLEKMDNKAWRQSINDLRGTLVTCPGKVA